MIGKARKLCRRLKRRARVFTIVIAVLLVAWWSIGFIPLGSPKLIVYFDQSPPEEVHPEDTFEVSIARAR